MNKMEEVLLENYITAEEARNICETTNHPLEKIYTTIVDAANDGSTHVWISCDYYSDGLLKRIKDTLTKDGFSIEDTYYTNYSRESKIFTGIRVSW